MHLDNMVTNIVKDDENKNSYYPQFEYINIKDWNDYSEERKAQIREYNPNIDDDAPWSEYPALIGANHDSNNVMQSLRLKNKELALYCGKQFAQLWRAL